MPIKTTRDVIREICKVTGLTNKARLALRTPIGPFIQGYLFESSSFSKTSFYLTVFIQPTYVPADYIFLTYGGRLKNADGIRGFELNLDDPLSTVEECLSAIRTEGEGFLNKVETVLDFATLSEAAPRMGDIHWIKDDIHVLEARAYSWALAGNIGKAIKCLAQIEKKVAKDRDDSDWVLELAERTKEMSRRLKNGDFTEFRAIVGDWRNRLLCAQRLSEVAATTPF